MILQDKIKHHSKIIAVLGITPLALWKDWNFWLKKLFVLIPFALLSLSTTQLKAQFFKGLELQGGMSFPSQIGARVRTNFESSFYATGGLGYLPGFMAQGGHSLMSTIGVVGEKTGVVLADGLTDSFVLDLRMGKSFSGELGWFGEVGYQYYTNGGGETSPRDIEESLGSNFINTFNSFDRADIFISLHCLALFMGYSWQVGDNLILTTNGGFVKPISNSIDTKYNTSDFEVQETDRELKNHLEDTLKTSYFMPTIEVWISYEFSN